MYAKSVEEMLFYTKKQKEDHQSIVTNAPNY